MKQRFDKSVGGLVFVGLLLVAGCATDKANLAQIDPQTPPAETQVKAQLDQSAVPAMESAAAPDETATGSTAQRRQDPETSTSTETQAGASPEPATPAAPETQAAAPSATQASIPAVLHVAAANDTPPSNEKSAVALPQQMVLYFGFNKDEISTADQAIVKQHAEYLLAHPEYTLLITGHADNRGPKSYNQRLSKLRARKVEQLLEADGVPGQQLHIKAMGATSPMVDPANYRQNRRVEFIYQDAVVAKGK